MNRIQLEGRLSYFKYEKKDGTVKENVAIIATRVYPIKGQPRKVKQEEEKRFFLRNDE